MHGARPRLAPRGRVSAAGNRTEVKEPGIVGVVDARLAEPPHRRAVELDLVDRLPGPDAAQLRRPVGGEDEQRHRRLVGLGDGRMEVRGGSSRGTEDGDRRPCRLSGSERREAAAPLVHDHAHVNCGSAPQRERQRRRARAGRQHRMPHPAPRQLLDEGGGERGVAIRRVHARNASDRPRPSAVDALRGESVLVELHAQPGAIREVQAPVTKLALARGDRLGEEPLRRQPVGQAGILGGAVDRLRGVGGRGDPDGTVERAGEVGGQPRGDRARGTDPADLRELRRGVRARLRSRSPCPRPWRWSRSRRRPPGWGSQRRPRRGRAGWGRAVRPARCPAARAARSSSIASSGANAPLASTRMRADGPTASRTARTCSTSSPAPSFSLNVSKPSDTQPRAASATLAGSPAGRVALQRTGAPLSPRRSLQTG